MDRQEIANITQAQVDGSAPKRVLTVRLKDGTTRCGTVESYRFNFFFLRDAATKQEIDINLDDVLDVS